MHDGWQLYCGLLAHFGEHKSDSGPIVARIIDGTLNNAKLKNSHKISRIINFLEAPTSVNMLKFTPKTL